ncbi:hypothetical protein GCM10010271_04610 [Streptomyces kurssanovii]|nr:hypothetical protein GCM10010271_04610 [Streptomyces kurssanovii]
MKKGTGTVGVQRQYTGTAGRIENAQVAVYLVYAGRRGHAAVDRELYVPRSWTSDPDRCRDAGLDQDTAFATKPEPATRMVPGSWTPATRPHGSPATRSTATTPGCEPHWKERGTGYVLAVACSHEVTTGAGRFRGDTLAKKVPKRAWQKLSAGAGAKGHRFYDWAVIDLADPRPGSRQLLIRRNRSTGELAYHRCYSPAPMPLTVLVRVAGSDGGWVPAWASSEACPEGRVLVRAIKVSVAEARRDCGRSLQPEDMAGTRGRVPGWRIWIGSLRARNSGRSWSPCTAATSCPAPSRRSNGSGSS